MMIWLTGSLIFPLLHQSRGAKKPADPLDPSGPRWSPAYTGGIWSDLTSQGKYIRPQCPVILTITLILLIIIAVYFMTIHTSEEQLRKKPQKFTVLCLTWITFFFFANFLKFIFITAKFLEAKEAPDALRLHLFWIGRSWTCSHAASSHRSSFPVPSSVNMVLLQLA